MNQTKLLKINGNDWVEFNNVTGTKGKFVRGDLFINKNMTCVEDKCKIYYQVVNVWAKDEIIIYELQIMTLNPKGLRKITDSFAKKVRCDADKLFRLGNGDSLYKSLSCRWNLELTDEVFVDEKTLSEKFTMIFNDELEETLLHFDGKKFVVEIDSDGDKNG